MASGIVVFIPTDVANASQVGQQITATVVQRTGVALYEGPTSEMSSNAPQQKPHAGLFEKLLKVETKTLGAIQILIGIMHIGLGTLSAILYDLQYYVQIATLGGYVFWGGLCFIISGSLSVSAEKHLTPGLVKWSLGMNIASGVVASSGIILLLAQLVLNTYILEPEEPKTQQEYFWIQSAGAGFSVLFLLFSMLEFCIAASMAHFGCQVTLCRDAQSPVVLVPYTAFSQSNLGSTSPPIFDPVDSSSQEKAKNLKENF